MTDRQFINQFRREAEEVAIAADRRRRLPSWQRRDQLPEEPHDLPYTLKLLELFGLR
jgi:hypothetical protein